MSNIMHKTIECLLMKWNKFARAEHLDKEWSRNLYFVLCSFPLAQNSNVYHNVLDCNVKGFAGDDKMDELNTLE